MFKILALIFVSVVVWSVICGASERMDSLISPCKSGTYITIDSLYAYCGLPGDCGKRLGCENQTALIQGYIDYENIFDKAKYPMLPYQKFLISNAEYSKTLEVWVGPEGSEAVFGMIVEKKACNPDGPIYVEGVLTGFDMPIMGTCHRGLKLDLKSAKFFQCNKLTTMPGAGTTKDEK